MKEIDEQQEEKKERTQALLPVRVLSVTGEGALVEWQAPGGGLSRATIPLKKIASDQAGQYTTPESILETGIPYGLAWEEIELSQPSGAQLAQALRAAGVWTKQDLFANPRLALGVLQSLYSVDLGKLITFASKEQNNG